MSKILASKTHTVPFAAFGSGGTPTIAIVNEAETELGYDIDAMIAAMQKALDDHFSPVWGTPARLRRYDKKSEIPKDAWQFFLRDVADMNGVLGYHNLMREEGVPISFVFVKTTRDEGGDVAVTASHELWEMLVDPGVQIWAEAGDGTLWAWETADAVEETDYEVDGVKISNFVFPSFFESFRKPKSTRFDFLGLVDRPFKLLKGGYTLIRAGSKIQQKFGSKAKEKRFEAEDRNWHRSQIRSELLKKPKSKK